MSAEHESGGSKKIAEPGYGEVGRARDFPAYLKCLRIYVTTPRRLRSLNKAIEQTREELMKERGPDAKVPGFATLRRQLDFGVEVDGYPVLAQHVDKIAAEYDAGKLDLVEIEGGGGPGPLLNAQNALSDAVVFTRKLLQRDDYLETAAKNPKVHVEMMGKLTEAVHKLAMTGAGPLGGRRPDQMTADEAFELVCKVLEAHPELADDVRSALAK